jgi:hypothetical protein
VVRIMIGTVRIADASRLLLHVAELTVVVVVPAFSCRGATVWRRHHHAVVVTHFEI